MGRIEIKVIPKSGRHDLRFDGGYLKVWLKAVPERGRANDELVRILAKYLKISQSRVRISRGSTSKIKTVDIEGISVNDLQQKIKKSA